MTPSNCLVNHESNSLNLETAKKLEYYYLNNCVEWIKARGLKTVCIFKFIRFIIFLNFIQEKILFFLH